jgi:periplasmic protein CpxP/Spy
MSPKTTEAVATELKRFAQELKLTDSQKEQLKTYLAEVYAKVQDFVQKNPSIAKGGLVEKVRALRSSMREQVVKFLTPEQLARWDAEVARAKEFLGHSVSQ